MEAASLLRQLKQHEGALLLDCGDALTYPNYLRIPGRPRAIETLNAAGYDAMAMGNREYGWRSSTTAAKLSGLNFPVLSANLSARGTTPQPVKPLVILPCGQLQVGVFGISPDMAPAGSLARRTSDLSFTDPVQAARRALDHLRDRCDLTLGLLHWGTNPQVQAELVESLQGLDLALMGHWHVRDGSLTQVGTVTVSRSAYHARQAAVLRLQPDESWEQELVDLP
jgi:5'-nucleotidase / UDP-sugar diphosphatase